MDAIFKGTHHCNCWKYTLKFINKYLLGGEVKYYFQKCNDCFAKINLVFMLLSRKAQGDLYLRDCVSLYFIRKDLPLRESFRLKYCDSLISLSVNATRFTTPSEASIRAQGFSTKYLLSISVYLSFSRIHTNQTFFGAKTILSVV